MGAAIKIYVEYEQGSENVFGLARGVMNDMREVFPGADLKVKAMDDGQEVTLVYHAHQTVG